MQDPTDERTNPGELAPSPPGAGACPACGAPWEGGSSTCPRCGSARLTGTTARPWLTLGLIGLNAAVYLGMLVAGISPTEPTTAELLRWGANLGSLTTSGQWWRLLTCTFLHIGFFHILFNMWVLWDIGRFMERLVGRPGFATTYLLSGLAGSIASMWWNPYVVSAGASGAIFGLYGGLLGSVAAGSQHLPRAASKGLQRNALLFIGFNLVWGLVHQGVDMAGHLGGLLGGLACGYALARGRDLLPERSPTHRPLQVLLAGLALLALAAGVRPRTADLQGALAQFAQVEKQVMVRYNQAIDQARSGRLPDAAFAQVMETEVLPPWHAARMKLASLQGLPPAQKQLLGKIERYADTRERAWTTFATALRQRDPAGIQRAAALHAEAETQLKDLGGA